MQWWLCACVRNAMLAGIQWGSLNDHWPTSLHMNRAGYKRARASRWRAIWWWAVYLALNSRVIWQAFSRTSYRPKTLNRFLVWNQFAKGSPSTRYQVFRPTSSRNPLRAKLMLCSFRALTNLYPSLLVSPCGIKGQPYFERNKTPLQMKDNFTTQFFSIVGKYNADIYRTSNFFQLDNEKNVVFCTICARMAYNAICTSQ